VATIEQLEAEVRRAEAKLNEHVLDDANKHGQMLGALGRIETTVAHIARQNEKLEDAADNTGSHQIISAEDKLRFWRDLFVKIGISVASIVLAAIVTYVMTRK
jgi:hypothetical protein